uniref:Uncharacterized protein n=1 Tax=Setaria viridis TaxID=4556 RepID=A0A4U6T4A7_SETVI|nr:hypothetical protein SEVIR_9G433600v2 [Setaria viridis]
MEPEKEDDAAAAELRAPLGTTPTAPTPDRSCCRGRRRRQPRDGGARRCRARGTASSPRHRSAAPASSRPCLTSPRPPRLPASPRTPTSPSVSHPSKLLPFFYHNTAAIHLAFNTCSTKYLTGPVKPLGTKGFGGS